MIYRKKRRKYFIVNRVEGDAKTQETIKQKLLMLAEHTDDNK